MPSSTVEDYVKQVFLLQQELGGKVVPMGRLSVAMGITPGTTTTMVKGLADDGYVNYVPRVGVELTEQGKTLALSVLRRHRIAEAFLVQVLKMDWSEVHDDAERLEHAISDKVLDKMDAFLNRPTHDPHGDPIPAVDGNLEHLSGRSIANSEVGSEVSVTRILDQSAEFLSYVSRSGLAPGATLRIVDRDKMADSVHVEVSNGERIALSTRVAENIAVG